MRVPTVLTVDLAQLQHLLDTEQVSLCAGRSDGWLIAKSCDDLFAPGCEQLLVPLSAHCFRIDGLGAFSAHAGVDLLSGGRRIVTRGDVDEKYRHLSVWPSTRQCPHGYTPVHLKLYVVQRQKYTWPNIGIATTTSVTTTTAPRVAHCADADSDGDVLVDNVGVDENTSGGSVGDDDEADNNGDVDARDWAEAVVVNLAVQRALHACCRVGDVKRLAALCQQNVPIIAPKLADTLLLEFVDALSDDVACALLRRCCAAIIPTLVANDRVGELYALAVLGITDAVAFDDALLTDAVSNDRTDIALALLEFRNTPHSADRVSERGGG